MSVRRTIPRAVRDQVLAEYRHRCSICGADRPQVHHIDENPENNAPLNLLPLCPNCHLTDQHNPTQLIDPLKLSLFRRYKDPAILLPQFQPIFARFVFLLSLSDSSDPWALEANSKELVEFISAFEMGEFYAKRIDALLKMSPVLGFIALNSLLPYEDDPQYQKGVAAYRQQLAGAKDQVIALCVELLRYQRWEPISRGKPSVP